MTFPVDKEVGPDRPAPTDTLPLSVAAQRHSGAEDLAKHGGNPGASGDLLLAAPPGEWWGARHTLAFMASLGIGVTYTMRINLSVAIVAMVGTSPSNGTDEPSDVCPLPDDYDPEQEATTGDFAWDETTQGLILGSFYYGYAASHFPVGRAAEHFGGRLAFGLGILCCSFFTLLTPLCASFSTELFVAIRILQGLALGGSFPSISTMVTTWFTPAERSKYTTFIITGMNIGTVVAMPVSGWLCSVEAFGGWPLAFYVFGVLGMVWSAAWFLLVCDRPEHHPRISPAELHYLKTAQQYMKEPEVVAIPWRAVLTSPYMWVLMVTGLGDTYGFYTLLTELPTYLANIQHFDMNKTGTLSALPYLISWLVSIGWGFLVGWLTTSGTLSVPNIRRLSQSVAYYVPALALVVMCFVDCDSTLAMVILCVAVGFTSTNFAGYLCSHQDMAPNLVGSLMGITSTFGSLMGVVSPAITGAIINENQTLSAWRIVFLTSAVVYVVTCTLYVVFIPVHVQPWNYPRPKTLDKQDDTPGRGDPQSVMAVGRL